MEQMHTIKDVQRQLKVSESTVRGLIDRGELQVVRIGRLVRIPESSLKKLVDQCRAGTNAAGPGMPAAHPLSRAYDLSPRKRAGAREPSPWKEKFPWEEEPRRFSWQRDKQPPATPQSP